MSPPGHGRGRPPQSGPADTTAATADDNLILRRPRIRGVVVIDLAPVVDGIGWLGGDVARHAASALGNVPDGGCARVELGRARLVDPYLAGFLAEYGAHLDQIQITGLDPRAVTALVAGMTPGEEQRQEEDPWAPAPSLRGIADAPTFAELCQRRGEPERAARARAQALATRGATP